MLSKKLAMQAMRCSRMATTRMYIGFLELSCFKIEDIWSMNLRNLKILREFFMEERRLALRTAPRLVPAAKASWTDAIYEYLLQL